MANDAIPLVAIIGRNIYDTAYGQVAPPQTDLRDIGHFLYGSENCLFEFCRGNGVLQDAKLRRRPNSLPREGN